MIRLYTLPPIGRAPSLSPFCMKVETYLRMARIEYEPVVVVDPRKGPKGKLPWIEDDGRRIGDSGLIVEHLVATRGDKVDGHLSRRDHATGHLVRRALEEHFYWAVVYSRWFDDANWRMLQPIFLGALPRPAQAAVGSIARAMMKRTIRAHGIGRHSHDEIVAAGRADIDALAAELADKEYLLGDRASSYDAIVHAFTANLFDAGLETPLVAHARSHANLVSYNARMNERWYPARPSEATPAPARAASVA